MERSSPSSPGSHSRGAWWVDVANRALPRPPRPPRATRMVSPGRSTSPSSSWVSASRTTVPGGTGRKTSDEDAPVWVLPLPCSPRSAFHTLR